MSVNNKRDRFYAVTRPCRSSDH